MMKDDTSNRHQMILEGVKVAITQALERHRRLGQSIAVWRDGKVAILDAEQIPPQPESQCDQAPSGKVTDESLKTRRA